MIPDEVNPDEYWMQHALHLAEKAQQQDEVPVGAIIVVENEIIGRGWNQSISSNDPTAHAEIVALRDAAANIANYRLPKESTLYVTLEPCAMCAGAMVHARVGRVVFGAGDPKSGAVTTFFNLLSSEQLNHRAEITSGVLETSCSDLLKQFFQARR